PTHAADGTIEVRNDTGIVFVLIPGGTFWQGAQKDDPTRPNYDVMAAYDESPSLVDLAPYFLARHEATKRQWKRLSDGGEPSQYAIITPSGHDYVDWNYPVENVSWTEGHRWLARHGLTLPTEAQWEYGARGRTTTPWWTGDSPSDVARAANLRDQSLERVDASHSTQVVDFDDGFDSLARVGQFAQNSFGLADVYGNVSEWCEDEYVRRYDVAQPESGLRHSRRTTQTLTERGVNAGAAGHRPITIDMLTPVVRVHRGGSYDSTSRAARSAARDADETSMRSLELGIRPARDLE
ncbi:MAG: formylglycine-generating enzyme family protein, partial [Planctomycetes bacterium]|nr:formylglycine-generating enzyme family protein [Planctomycetota bacterium]